MVEKSVTLQIFGSLMKTPSILTNSEKYFLLPDDFSGTFERNLFSVIFNLFHKGVRNITLVDITEYLKNSPGAEKIFYSNNGVEFLQDAENLAEPENFDYYYNKLKKYNFLRDLKKSGTDISKYYVEDPLDPSYYEKSKKLEEIEIKDILDDLRLKHLKLEEKYNKSDISKTEKISSGLDTLFERLNANQNVGQPLQGEIFSSVTKGARFGKFYVRSASSGAGKALPNSTLIPTPYGKRKIGDIKVGDLLFDRKGQSTRVLGVFPQGKKKKYSLIFDDGTAAECCDEHLWSYWTEEDFKKGGRNLSTESLSYIRKNLDKTSFLLPINQPTIYSEKKFSHKLYKVSERLTSLALDPKNTIDLTTFNCYLEGNLKQRFQLLNGLLKVGGKVGPTQLFYCTESSFLNYYLAELARSLGFKVTQRFTTFEKEKIYLLCLQGSGEQYKKLDLIKELPKQERQQFYSRRHDDLFKRIVNVIEWEQEEEMTCFLVDNKEHLFLINSYTVTHNTRSSVGDAALLAFPFIYNSKKGKWDYHGCSEKVFFIATEQEQEEIQTMTLAYLADVNEEKIIFNTLNKEEEERILQAKSIMEHFEDNFLFRQIPNPDIAQMRSIIRTETILSGVKYVFFDYIFAGTSLLSEFRDLRLRTDEALMMFSTALKDLATELDIFILSSTQTNAKGDGDTNMKGAEVIRGARSIIDKADLGCVIYQPSDQDRDLLQGVIDKVNSENSMPIINFPNLVTDIYKLRGKYNNVKIWSYIDFGTCRRTDLFITNPWGEVIEDFEHFSYEFNIDTLGAELENLKRLNRNETVV